MCNGRLFAIGILNISTIVIVLLMIYANTGEVNAENNELEDAFSEGVIEDKITKVKGSSKTFLISIPNAQGSESEETNDECQDDTDCSNKNSNEKAEIKEMQSSTEILLPFP
jgi:hypothetical protein